MSCCGFVGGEEGRGCVNAAVGEEVDVDSLTLTLSGGVGWWVVEEEVVQGWLSRIRVAVFVV